MVFLLQKNKSYSFFYNLKYKYLYQRWQNSMLFSFLQKKTLEKLNKHGTRFEEFCIEVTFIKKLTSRNKNHFYCFEQKSLI